MASPFGGHPTFERYLDWAAGEGCAVDESVAQDQDGRAYRLTRIAAPSGRWTVEVDLKPNDYLVPTTVARLDRKLGLQSPFFSLPDSQS